MTRTANKDAGALIAARREFQGSNLCARVERYALSLGRLQGVERDRYLATCRAQADAGGAMYVVYSYATPVAWTPADGAAEWTLTRTRYSVTTSKHLHIVRGALARAGIPSTPPGWAELVAEAARLGAAAGENAGTWHVRRVDSPPAARETLDGSRTVDAATPGALPACPLDDEDIAAVLQAAPATLRYRRRARRSPVSRRWPGTPTAPPGTRPRSAPWPSITATRPAGPGPRVDRLGGRAAPHRTTNGRAVRRACQPRQGDRIHRKGSQTDASHQRGGTDSAATERLPRLRP